MHNRIRTLTLILVLGLGTLAVSTGNAEARPRPKGFGKSDFEANKTFGLGIMLGSPSGLSGKYFVGKSTAIDFGIGFIGCCRGRDGLHVHADFLWHFKNLVHTEPFELPIYFGVGGRFFNYDWDRRNDPDDHGTAIGVRAPIGIAFDFNNVPLDIFVELVPVLDLIMDDDDDGFHDDGLYFDFDGAVGARYYFN
jgi:hypothetical protein